MIPLLAAAAFALASSVDRTVTDPRITESSGLAVSPQHPGVLWTHDDSGNPPLLFALGPSGAVAATVRISGVPDVDWEAMAAFRDAGGHALLAAADIGDNGAVRDHIEVDVVPEPAPLRSVTVAPLLRLRLTYPDGPRDAETLVVDTARRRMFVVSKGLLSSRVYLVPRSAWDGTAPSRPQVRSARLVPVGTVPLVLVTDGTETPSGAVLLRTYGELAVLDPFPLEQGDPLLTARTSTGLPGQRQGEGLALSPGGRSVLLSSEGTGQPVLRVDLPQDVSASLAPTPAPSSTPTTTRPATPAPTKAAAAAAPPAATGGGSTRWPVVGTALLLLAVAAGVGLTRRRPHS